MSKAIILCWFICGSLIQMPLYALDAAFATNGVIVAVPVKMPVVGTLLADGRMVANLYGADRATRAACGWYECQYFDRSTVATNQRVVSTAWKIEGFKAVQSAVVSNKVNKVALSRKKLAGLAKSKGWTEKFMGFVNSDPEIAVRWYSEERLVAGSEEMRPFIEGFAALVGVSYGDALKLLEGCRE